MSEYLRVIMKTHIALYHRVFSMLHFSSVKYIEMCVTAKY